MSHGHSASGKDTVPKGIKQKKYCIYRFVTSSETLEGYSYRTKSRRNKTERANEACMLVEGKWQLQHCHFNAYSFDRTDLRSRADLDALGEGVSTQQRVSSGRVDHMVFSSERSCGAAKSHWKATSALRFLCRRR